MNGDTQRASPDLTWTTAPDRHTGRRERSDKRKQGEKKERKEQTGGKKERTERREDGREQRKKGIIVPKASPLIPAGLWCSMFRDKKIKFIISTIFLPKQCLKTNFAQQNALICWFKWFPVIKVVLCVSGLLSSHFTQWLQRTIKAFEGPEEPC